MNVSTATQLGAAIKDRRRRLKITQQDLATRVGTTRRWLLAVENGHPRAEVGLVLKTLAALGLRLVLDDGSAARVAGDVPAPPDIDAVIHNTRTRTQ
ncbi:MAG: helix-turn-helix transcriptional regulator [Deltaproteobacteria bacterium]|nr:helix-turn-helix transcriptional regulator [Deltaproteobacteria bacterium]